MRERIAEYCGVEGGAPPTALRIAGFGGTRRLSHSEGAPIHVTYPELPDLLSEGADVCRSLADSGGALVQLDVDYVSPADAAEPYRWPDLCFARLEPVYREIVAVLSGYGLTAICVMSGRGYHFTLRVPLGSRFHRALVDLGEIAPSLASRYAELERELPGALEMGRAHEGAGRLLELLSHEVIRRLRGRLEVPLTLADVPPPGNGAFICLDLSAFGDPLFERNARCAFSANQKSTMRGIAPEREAIFCIPRNGEPLDELLAVRQHADLAVELASRVSTRIPDAPDDPRWVDAYLASPLHAVHLELEREVDSPSNESLPTCALVPLLVPNPALLRPVFLRTVTYVLWSQGSSPRAIAERIERSYLESHGWGDQWARYDPATRARFYVRLFCGSLAGGLDDEDAFSCASQRLREACPYRDCGHELADYKGPLSERLAPGAGCV